MYIHSTRIRTIQEEYIGKDQRENMMQSCEIEINNAYTVHLRESECV